MAKAMVDAWEMQDGYKTIEHTADIGIQVKAGSAEELFALSACAMFDLMVNLTAVRPAQKAQVSLRADSLDELMVSWLNELLFRAEVSGMFFSRFEVESVSESSLTASVWGEPYNERTHSISTSIKAATYHELEIAQTAAGWSARLIFDV